MHFPPLTQSELIFILVLLIRGRGEWDWNNHRKLSETILSYAKAFSFDLQVLFFLQIRTVQKVWDYNL